VKTIFQPKLAVVKGKKMRADIVKIYIHGHSKTYHSLVQAINSEAPAIVGSFKAILSSGNDLHVLRG